MISSQEAMTAVAEAKRQLPESGHEMSNFDHSADDGLEADLRAGMRAAHQAWNFNGMVWYDEKAGLFYEAVRVYGVVEAVIGRPSLDELMRDVNDQFGWE
jgi:hypothetical protein